MILVDRSPILALGFRLLVLQFALGWSRNYSSRALLFDISNHPEIPEGAWAESKSAKFRPSGRRKFLPQLFGREKDHRPAHRETIEIHFIIGNCRIWIIFGVRSLLGTFSRESTGDGGYKITSFWNLRPYRAANLEPIRGN